VEAAAGTEEPLKKEGGEASAAVALENTEGWKEKAGCKKEAAAAEAGAEEEEEEEEEEDEDSVFMPLKRTESKMDLP
jgi:hypothetical protein